MKLTKGTKPIDYDSIIPANLRNIKRKIKVQGSFIEIDTDDMGLIAFFRSQGFN